MAGVQADDGQFLIYYQGKDYKIYKMALLQAGSTKSQIRDLSTSMPVPARIITPIAAFQWNSLQCIRVYYITETSQVQEIIFQAGGGWFPGTTLGTTVENSNCLYAQVQSNIPQAALRIGFESSTAPQTITEAVFLGPKEGWVTRVI
ncbi:hypothetical protein M405DRAFT_819930 [Rhizopogon salebrosus TDB-379]|nr:hypothetical protein M405DRAFT_819930 [Rhizopogon salebrosus TDB-379]